MGGKPHSFGKLKTNTFFIPTPVKPNVISTLRNVVIIADMTTSAITVKRQLLSDVPGGLMQQPSGGSVAIWVNSEAKWRRIVP